MSNAVKTPVIAVIEYNYERDGEIVIPAGTKATGQLTQANQNGQVGLRFTYARNAGWKHREYRRQRRRSRLRAAQRHRQRPESAEACIGSIPDWSWVDGGVSW